MANISKNDKICHVANVRFQPLPRLALSLMSLSQETEKTDGDMQQKCQPHLWIKHNFLNSQVNCQNSKCLTDLPLRVPFTDLHRCSPGDGHRRSSFGFVGRWKFHAMHGRRLSRLARAQVRLVQRRPRHRASFSWPAMVDIAFCIFPTLLCNSLYLRDEWV